ncbi:lysyl-tRNA synthetase [Alcanivorax xiamenensis]|uniref:Lysyl-tRNA synthetase n=1 Tax=Alcanivorax xiamenensis TaxID=1177156 RepID=A0ABQ6YD96_9GAMM|nr:EF-P lysine aminoacylase EpmA [Alcanivorax xiamenensis]KAF0807792.1 lysyl-tRNA synthetase [Alcanivorax xiamenensis]
MSSRIWQPAASLEAMKARAELLSTVRAFFADRGVLEVETPALATHGVTDPHIHCIEVPGYGWLQSSPEYHMKRLLAAGSGPIYQLSRVFRHGEAGPRHNPEFTMLEWYRPGFSLEQLIDECLALLGQWLRCPHTIRPFRHLFAEVTGLDPLTCPPAALVTAAVEAGAPHGLDHGQSADFLMATQVETALDPATLTVVTDFPAWAAALAQVREDEDGVPVARRFEIYHGGLELANGYQELTDAGEQARRFAADNQQRAGHGDQAMAPDPHLLAALQAGLPPCSGVAMGVERLLMAIHGYRDIRQVLTFPTQRA